MLPALPHTSREGPLPDRDRLHLLRLWICRIAKRRTSNDNEEAVWIDDRGEFPAPDDTLLSIANVAKMFDISRMALRFYEGSA